MLSIKILLLNTILLTSCYHVLPYPAVESPTMVLSENLQDPNDSTLKKGDATLGNKNLERLFQMLNSSFEKMATFNTTEQCNDKNEVLFHDDILGVPLAAELYDLATVIIYLLKGCSTQAYVRFTELLHMLEDQQVLEDVVSDLLKSLRSSSNLTYNNTMPASKKYRSNESFSETLENILRPLQVLQSSSYKEQGIGFLQCKWVQTAGPVADNRCHRGVSGIVSDMSNTKQDWRYRTFKSLVEAKLSCEHLQDECNGVSKSLGNASSYFHFKRCNEFDSKNDYQTWMKNCSKKSNNMPQVHFSNDARHRLHRRGTGDQKTEVKVTFYAKQNYQGSNKEFPNYVEFVGDDWDNKVTSMKCSDECSIIAFEHAQFHGRQKSFIGDAPFVGHEKLNTISSLVVVPYKLSILCYVLYEHSYYRGKHQRFCGDQILPENWKHIVSSFKLECNGCSAVLYDQDYVGHFKSFDGNVDWIGHDWNDITEAVQIRPWKYDSYEGQLMPDTIFYEHSQYRGNHLTLRESTEFVGRAMNDKISSFTCHPPCSVIAFEHSEYKGDSILYEGSQNFVGKKWNDKISSVVVLPQKLCVTFYTDSKFEGASKTFCSDNTKLTYLYNDQFSSLKVLECDVCSVVVYEHENYGGNADVFYGETSFVGDAMNDKITSFRIRPWKIEKPKKSTAVATKKSCVNKDENKAHNIIQWIPFISSIYDLATSIYYGAKGCHDVAKERAIGMAIDLGMDVATVLSGGSAAPIAYGIKTGVKFGVKAGLKAVIKAGAAVAKNAVKNAVKTGGKILKAGVKSNFKSLAKSGFKSAKGLLHQLKNVPKAIKSGIKSGVSTVHKKGFKQSVKGIGKKIKSAAKKKFDDLAESAEKQIDGNPVKKTSGKALCRKRRSDGKADFCTGGAEGTSDQGAIPKKKGAKDKKYKHKGEDLERLHRAGDRAEARAASERLEHFYDEINKSPTSTLEYQNKGGSSSIEVKEIQVPEHKQVKPIFQDLQQYMNNIDDGGKLTTPTGIRDSKFGLKVEMTLGEVPFEFVLMPARDNQVFVSFVKKYNVQGSHSYDGIVQLLDEGDDLARQARASSILMATNSKTGGSKDMWGSMTDEQIEAAQELIVLTQIVEPVRVQGADKLARSQIKDVKDHGMTFAQIFTETEHGEARFILARKGGVKKMKGHVNRPSNDKDQKLVDGASKDMSASSSDENRRRRALA